ncbi:hypothetical protein DRN94_001695 [archaeon]|nr:hypothetical protein [archaeon]
MCSRVFLRGEQALRVPVRELPSLDKLLTAPQKGSGAFLIRIVKRRRKIIDWQQALLCMIRALPGVTRWVRLYLKVRNEILSNGDVRSQEHWVLVNASSETRTHLVREYADGGGEVHDVRAYDEEGELPLLVERIGRDIVRFSIGFRRRVRPGGVVRFFFEYTWPRDATPLGDGRWEYYVGKSTADVWGFTEEEYWLPQGAKLIEVRNWCYHLHDPEVREEDVIPIRVLKNDRVVLQAKLERPLPGRMYVIHIIYELPK